MLPKESTLKKEFSKRDVQRMRNLISGKSGDRTHVQVGYEKKSQDYKEGDVWEANGKKWTIKNGVKQSVTKLDKFKHLVSLPLTCPCCKKPMRSDDLNKKMYAIHQMCLDCVIEMETKLKARGEFDDYQKNILNSNKNASLEEFEQAVESWLQDKNTYITEQGDIESWQGGDKTKIYKQIKEKIDELKRTDIY